MSVDLGEGVAATLEQSQNAVELRKENSLFSPLWDALASISPSGRSSSKASSPLAWVRRSKDGAKGKKRLSEETHGGRSLKRNGAGPLRSSPLRMSHSPETRRTQQTLEEEGSQRDDSRLSEDVSSPYNFFSGSDPPRIPSRSPRRQEAYLGESQQKLTEVFDRHNRARGPFRPTTRSAGKGTPSWQLRQFAEATLGSGSLRKAVKLPEGEDENEWLAVNGVQMTVVDFYNQLNLLYGSITEFCSPTSCPEMKASDEYEYLWQDSSNPQFKRPTKMPAPEYVEHLMSWCQANIDNTDLFPAKLGVQFPKQFKPTVTSMFKRLYRVYAHIYCHHYAVVVQLGLEAHLNTSFKHFCLFVEEFRLADGGKNKDDFWGPLGEFVEAMMKVE
ncbi:MAG: hypothetical protein Q9159_003303 [Coniocarpon cinnabarinum]